MHRGEGALFAKSTGGRREESARPTSRPNRHGSRAASTTVAAPHPGRMAANPPIPFLPRFDLNAAKGTQPEEVLLALGGATRVRGAGRRRSADLGPARTARTITAPGRRSPGRSSSRSCAGSCACLVWGRAAGCRKMPASSGSRSVGALSARAIRSPTSASAGARAVHPQRRHAPAVAGAGHTPPSFAR